MHEYWLNLLAPIADLAELQPVDTTRSRPCSLAPLG